MMSVAKSSEGGDTVYEQCLEGDDYEMGLGYGRMLAEVGFAPPAASPPKLAFARECERIVREHAPELLEELRGVADGGRFDPALINSFALTLGEQPACSVVAISGRHTADGGPLFGRNFDFFEWDAEHQEIYRTYPEGRLASIGCSDVFVGREDGVNEAGLAMAQTHVSGTSVEPGVLFSIAGRMVLDRCRDVPEAVALLESIPHVRANNWLLADARDAIAIVETGPGGVAATYAEDGFAIATNQFRSPGMRSHERVEERPPDSEPRMCALQAWWDGRTGKVGAAEVRAVLSGHADGVCVHRTDLPQPLLTIRSLVLSPGQRRMEVADGPPCSAPFEVYEF